MKFAIDSQTKRQEPQEVASFSNRNDFRVNREIGFCIAQDEQSKSKRFKDGNGFLHVAVSNISKECVSPYYGREVVGYEDLGLEPEKIYYAYRKGEELKKGAHTFNNLPLMRGHFIDSAENPQREHRVGSLGTDCNFASPYLQNSLCVTDGEAIRKIESGERVELSAAYAYTPVFEAGTFEGQSYDFVMTEIRGNHVALVEEGRAGSDVYVADSKFIQKEKKQMSLTSKQMAEYALLKAKFALDEAKKATDEAGGEAIAKAQEALAEIIETASEAVASASNEDTVINADAEKFNAKEAYKTGENDQIRKEEKAGDKACDEDKNKKIDELLANLKAKGMTDDELKKWKDSLTDLAYTMATGDAMTIGEAVESGENHERDKLMKEHTGDTKAMDSATIARVAKDEAMKSMREMQQACTDVRRLVGDVDMFAFDSAEAIYMHACKLKNVEANPSSAKHVALALVGAGTFAQDSAKTFDNSFKSQFDVTGE